MRHYIAIVHKDADSAYGVQFPDVPGCYSAADDLAALVPNAVDALSLYAEDLDLPEPRSLDCVTSDPAVVDAVADGAFLMAVPLG